MYSLAAAKSSAPLLMSKLMMLISSLLFLEEISVLISFSSWSSCFLLTQYEVNMYVCIYVWGKCITPYIYYYKKGPKNHNVQKKIGGFKP